VSSVYFDLFQCGRLDFRANLMAEALLFNWAVEMLSDSTRRPIVFAPLSKSYTWPIVLSLSWGVD